MAKLKMKSTMVAAPRDAGEASGFLEQIGRCQRSRVLIAAEFDAQVAVLRALADAQAKPLDDEMKRLTQGLQLWAEANRAALTREGATKTVALPSGTVAWRTRPASVRIVGAEAVLGYLQAHGIVEFLRLKTEIDKEAMLRSPAAAQAVPGVSIGSEGELFVVEPASVDLAGGGAP